MNNSYIYKINLLLVTTMVSLSCYNDDPSLIQLPDRTPPAGYIINPLDGSSVSGNITLQVIAIDNEEVDTVYFMIKPQSAEYYLRIDSTTNESDDIWKGNWDTRNSQWIENENYFITFRAVDLVGNSYIAPPVIVKVDNQDDEAPTGYIKNPITGQVVNGTVDIEVEASDNTSMQYVSILINNDLKVTHLTEPYNYQWNTEEEDDDLVYSIYAVLVDIDNNRTTIPPISVTVNNQLPTDVTPPTGALTSPPAGSTVSGNTMIQVTAADDQLLDYIEFYIDGQLNGTTQCNGPSCTASYEWNTLEEDEGEHTIQVILFDGWNNNTVLTSVNVWVDNFDDDTIHPNVVIIEPASGQTVSGDVMIEALATDNTGIDRVEFFIETDLVHIDSIGPDYNYTWNTVTLPDDQDYIISLVCYDLIGNEGPSTPITVYLDNYDNITPNGTILYPYAGQSVSGIETISVYADDNDEVSQVEFFIDNVLDYTDTEEPYEYEWDTATEAEDLNHIIGAIITDASVNIFEVPSISVYVNNIPNDTSPPIVIISSPSNGQTVSGTVNFSVLANDDSGISFVEFFIDGESLGTAESEPYTYVWDTTLGLGEHGDQHALSASAEDIAGNVSFAQPILVTVSETEENHSLGFDGMDDYVNVQYGVDLDMSNALTIAAWVKPIYNNEESTIAMKGSYGYGFALTNNGTSNCSSNNEPNLVYWDQGDCGQAINSSITYEFDQWQHVAVTAEDVGNQLEIYFYVNGEQDGPYYSDELSISNGGDSMALMIGIQWGGWNVFYGNIDDLAIWNAALSAGQISGLAATGSPEEISGLSAHWDFNEGSGSTLYDQTANANHGTITGPVWSTDVP